MPDVAERLQQLVQVTEAADAGLGEDLWLIAERIMLYRLTRAGQQKRLELATMVNLLIRIISETQGKQNLPPELSELAGSASNEFKGSGEANLSPVFTTVVDVAENMNPEQLYLLISALRKIELPKQEIIEVESAEESHELADESFQPQEEEWNL